MIEHVPPPILQLPGPLGHHGLVEPRRLGLDDGRDLLLRRAEFPFRLGGHPIVENRKALDLLARRIEQDQLQRVVKLRRIDLPAVVAGQRQDAVRVETGIGHRAVGKVLCRPAPLLGNRGCEIICQLLQALLLDPRGCRQDNRQRGGIAPRSQQFQQGGTMLRLLTVLFQEIAHPRGRMTRRGTDPKGKDAFGLDAFRARSEHHRAGNRFGIAGVVDPAVEHPGRKHLGLTRDALVEIDREHARLAGRFQLERLIEPPHLHVARHRCAAQEPQLGHRVQIEKGDWAELGLQKTLLGFADQCLLTGEGFKIAAEILQR